MRSLRSCRNVTAKHVAGITYILSNLLSCIDMEEKIINGYPFVPYAPPVIDEVEMLRRSLAFFQQMDQRRSVREFSSRPVSEKVMENILRTASTAPSGAHKQPWTFCLVSSPELKKQIRIAAEKEEYESYHSRMNEEWLKDLRPLQTSWEKPFLEVAPYLVVVFKQVYGTDASLGRESHYYVNESVGLACGLLLAAIHQAGLVSLTHTPSPMNFLTGLLQRPANERPFLLIPVGYPADSTYVPKLKRKALDKVCVYYR